jgi:hypothetical protein
MSRRNQSQQRSTNWKRLAIATFAIYWGLALLVLLVCEVILPAGFSSSTPAPSGFNYGAMFGANFFGPFGWIVAGALVVLAPVTLLFRGADDLGYRMAGWVRRGK